MGRADPQFARDEPCWVWAEGLSRAQGEPWEETFPQPVQGFSQTPPGACPMALIPKENADVDFKIHARNPGEHCQRTPRLHHSSFSIWWTGDKLQSSRTITSADLTCGNPSRLPLGEVFPQVELHVVPLVCYRVFMYMNICTLVLQSHPPILHFELNCTWWLTIKSWSRASCHAALHVSCSP